MTESIGALKPNIEAQSVRPREVFRKINIHVAVTADEAQIRDILHRRQGENFAPK
jgi:hypothetical protein